MEERNHLGHTRKERKDNLLIALFCEQWHDYFDKLYMCLKAKSLGGLAFCLPLFFVLGKPNAGRIFFPYTHLEIWQSRPGDYFRECYNRCPLFEEILDAEEIEFLIL